MEILKYINKIQHVKKLEQYARVKSQFEEFLCNYKPQEGRTLILVDYSYALPLILKWPHDTLHLYDIPDIFPLECIAQM